jgi:HAD superfamily hydrolase (TIGR01549 family)
MKYKKYDGFVFDIDGVLIDTSQSFRTAVIRAVAFATNSDCFTADKVVQLKSIHGFNNDWNVSIAGAGWVQYRQGESFEWFIERLNQLGGGLTGLRQVIPELTPAFEAYLSRLTQEAYGGISACNKLYGFDPEYIRIPGLWQMEIPLINFTQIEDIFSKSGIVTGRNRAETVLAFDLLGWRLPEDVVMYSTDPTLDKPNPIKLKQVIKKLRCDNPLFIGDSIDDLELVKNYRIETGGSMDFCLISKSKTLSDYDLQFDTACNLLKNLGINNG